MNSLILTLKWHLFILEPERMVTSVRNSLFRQTKNRQKSLLHPYTIRAGSRVPPFCNRAGKMGMSLDNFTRLVILKAWWNY